MDWDSLLRDEVSSYDTSEWNGELGGKNVTLYAKPVSNADIAIVQKKTGDWTSQEGFVEMLIRKAQDADGKRVFTTAHRPLLMRLKPALTNEIAMSLFVSTEAETDESFEERVGN
jgi:hypothetical protein